MPDTDKKVEGENSDEKPSTHQLDVPAGSVQEKIRKLSGDAPTSSKAQTQLELLEAQLEVKYEIMDDDVNRLKCSLTQPNVDPREVESEFSYLMGQSKNLEQLHISYINLLAKEKQLDKLSDEERRLANFQRTKAAIEFEVRDILRPPNPDPTPVPPQVPQPDSLVALHQRLTALQRNERRILEASQELETQLKAETPSVSSIEHLHSTFLVQLEEFLVFHLTVTNELPLHNMYEDFDRQMATRLHLQEKKIYFDRCVRKLVKKDTPPKHESVLSETHAAYKRHKNLPTFSGNVREWLTFWATFQQTHESNIPTIEKFKLLLSTTTEKSAARKLVQSFPMTETNYQPVIEALKERYGRENVLTKVYVRDLLQLVVTTATGRKMDFTEMVTKITSQIRNLEQLGVTNDRCADILYPVVESCLTEDVLLAWQRNPSHREELDELIKFLQHEVNHASERKLAHFAISTNTQQNSGNRSNRGNSSSSSNEASTASSLLNATSGSNKVTCLFCSGEHYSNSCQSALTMPYQTRVDKVKATGRCFVCFKRGHTRSSCPRKDTTKCPECSGAHQLVMCPNLPRQSGNPPRLNATAPSSNRQPEQAQQRALTEPPAAAPSDSSTPTPPRTSTTISNIVSAAEVPLQSLLLTSPGKAGSLIRLRAVLDTASQSSYIRTACLDSLKSTVLGEEQVVHQLFGGSRSPIIHQKLELVLGDSNGDLPFRVTLSTVPKITDYQVPPSVTAGRWVNLFAEKGIQFTDLLSSSNEIDVLLGNDLLPHLYTGRIEILPGGPAAMETKWGWVLCGTFPSAPNRSPLSTSLINTLLVSSSIPDMWSLEAIGITDSAEQQSKAELQLQTQRHFDETVTREVNGRYQVQLPFLEGRKPTLPSNYFIAYNRLQSTTRVLQKEGYLEKYNQVFQEWEKLGIIEKVSPIEDDHQQRHFLPHRHVLKLSSSSTPIRPVFDASSKAKGKPSLNDCLESGPNLLELIPALLIRFRLHPYAATADIAKAFLQVSVYPPHRDFLRFLWWADSSCSEIVEFRHCRAVFGVSSSPFLLGATLNLHLRNVAPHHEETAATLSTSLYVDNAIVSLPTPDQVLNFQKESREILASAHFDLRDWVTGRNCAGPVTSVLGLLWDPNLDTLQLDLTSVLKRLEGLSTPRDVLSVVHSLFDPLGFIAPFTLLGKVILRQCHNEKLTWKMELPPQLQQAFSKWKSQIPSLKEIRIPRFSQFGSATSNSLHVFCDASESAYAAIVILRSELPNGTVTANLLQAKTRLAPRNVTIPRLELLSCLVAARLATSVTSDMKVTLPVHFWSDSSVALHWIKGEGPWAVFVQNRVEEIRRLTDPVLWSHIPGAFNPADIFSRGCSASQLINCKTWTGPEWLLEPEVNWPNEPEEPNQTEVVKEMSKSVVSAVTTVAPPHPFLTFLKLSNYDKIVAAIARWKRCAKLLWQKFKSTCTPFPDSQLSTSEIVEAEEELLKVIQSSLHNQPDVIKNLHAFIDGKGLLRTRTRLTHRDEEAFLTPIILPEKDPFVNLLIRWEHELTCHAGTQTLLGHLRERFWIVNGRRTVRSEIGKCWICRRFNSRRVAVPEGPLPSQRTSSGAAFSVIGVDMAGPLILKDNQKVWITLFTCAKYRAIHIEVVDTLSTEGFLTAFRRFAARKGRPDTVFSDCGLNFVGANRVLQHQREIRAFAVPKKINWIFSPSAAPWWCGFIERMVGLTKQLLRRILGNRVVRLQELITLSAEVEDVVNNRPLTYMSEDPGDLIPLTPNHFVRNSFLQYLPELDLRDASHARAAYRKLQHLREALQSRFRAEYLGFLQHQHPDRKGSPELQVGDVVIIEDDNRKRTDWPLALVTAVMPSRDGAARVCRLRTKTGEIIRPAKRLFPIELPDRNSINPSLPSSSE